MSKQGWKPTPYTGGDQFRYDQDIYNPRKRFEAWHKAENKQANAPRFIKKLEVLDPTNLRISKWREQDHKSWRSDYDNPYKLVPHIEYLPKRQLGYWNVEETGFCNFNVHKHF